MSSTPCLNLECSNLLPCQLPIAIPAVSVTISHASPAAQHRTISPLYITHCAPYRLPLSLRNPPCRRPSPCLPEAGLPRGTASRPLFVRSLPLMYIAPLALNYQGSCTVNLHRPAGAHGGHGLPVHAAMQGRRARSRWRGTFAAFAQSRPVRRCACPCAAARSPYVVICMVQTEWHSNEAGYRAHLISVQRRAPVAASTHMHVTTGRRPSRGRHAR